MQEQMSIQDNLKLIPNIMVKIITNPVGFYREMPKDGGFIEPLIFMICMGVISGIIHAVLALFGIGPMGSFIMALASIIIVPVLVVIFGFAGGLILFIIWKIMGSQESFETAYRCGAYASGITPITGFLNIIPYVGAVIGLIWMTLLMIIASTEVHNVNKNTALIVFGIICLIFAVASVSSRCAQRRVQNAAEKWEKRIGKDLEDMTPEEAGKAMGNFLKGLQESTGKK